MPLTVPSHESGRELPRNVVLFDQYPYLGGGQVLLLSAIQASIDVALEVTVLIPTGGALEKNIRGQFGERVRVVATSLPPLTHGRKTFMDAFRLAVWSIWLLFRHLTIVLRADLLYGNGPRQFPLLFVWSVLLRKRCCYHVHIDLDGFGKRLVAFVSRFAMTHRIVVNSAFIQRGLLAAITNFAGRSKVVLIENALGPKYSGREFVRRWAGRKSIQDVLVPGVMRPEKGQDVAVELARRMPGIRLHLVGRVGEGSEDWVDALRVMAPPNVLFHGPVDDLGVYIEDHGIRIVLVPSRWDEPFGLVAIEGMAESCVTVVSAKGALPAIASKTGALVCATDDAALARLFEELGRRSPEELESLARRQFTATMREFGPERLIAQLRELISIACASGLRAR